ncbi:MAG: UDP-3-O-(3-hydroxymyristoyl)glucosamine N-acyltransferase [Phycisphaerae bacterium]
MVSLRLTQLCTAMAEQGLKAELHGEDRLIRAVNTLDAACEGEISFLSNPKYTKNLKSTAASAVIVADDTPVPHRLSAIRCSDPYAAVTVAIIEICGHKTHPVWGVSDGAWIDPSAKLGRDANIAPGATVAAGVTLGDRCTLYPGCYLANGVALGDDCVLHPNVVIYNDCVLGDRVTIHAGSVIGEDGLGYAPHHDKWLKIPQIGRTVLGDDVEIGANCTVDRATLGQTEIGDGTKFGNMVVIGHGTKVGPHCLFVGQVGVAGSVTIGRHVTLAGQVGVKGHITIEDNVRVGGKSGVWDDLSEGAEVFGSPAVPVRKAIKAMSVLQSLPDWVRRVKDLERQVALLQRRLEPVDRA